MEWKHAAGGANGSDNKYENRPTTILNLEVVARNDSAVCVPSAGNIESNNQ